MHQNVFVRPDAAAKFSMCVVGALALFATALASPAHAQGLTDSVYDVNLPSQQTAAADDAWALYSNPAGLAYVDSLQLMAGYSGRFDFDDNNRQQLNSLGQAVFGIQPVDGLTIGGGSGLFVPTDFQRQNGQPASIWRNSLAVATRIGRVFSVGASVHAMRANLPGAPFRWQGSFGFQLRPASFVAVGGAIENIGADALGPELTAFRAGVSLRPIGDLVTVGVDARVTSGSRDLFFDNGNDYFSKSKFEPAVSARVDLGGVAIVAAARLRDFTPFTPGGVPQIEGSLLFEVNTSNLGVALLGSGSSSLPPASNSAGAGFFARISSEAYPSILPAGRRWPTFSLVGPAVVEGEKGGLLSSLFSSPTPPEALLAELDRAARDPGVEGVVLRLRSLTFGWGRATEFRSLIKHLRQEGKFVAVHLDGADDVMMYVASAANRIYVSPAAQLDLNGVHVSMTYFADALARVGVKAEAIAAGAYKSAPRTVTHSSPSKEELEVQNAILDEVFGTLVGGLSDGRGLTEEEVRDILTYGGLSAEEAKAKRLVDDICYWSSMAKVLGEDSSVEYEPDFDFHYLSRNDRVTSWESTPTIAVVPVVGAIQQGRAGGGLFNILGSNGVGADDVVDALNAARDNSDIEAVVIRIDSPGGDALASDLIWHAVMELRLKKHVVISMGDLAASGGYYIAAAGEHIFAEPQTLTGSIGVFSMFFQGQQLASDLGVRTYEIGRGGPQPPTIFTSPNPKARAVMERQVAQIYERFLDAIVEGRDIDRDALKKVAGGHVWTGRQALERNLVDELGGLDDALRKARELAGIGENEPSNIAILFGDDEVFPKLSTAVSTLLSNDVDVKRARRAFAAIVGSDAAALQLAAEGRPLLMSPTMIQVR